MRSELPCHLVPATSDEGCTEEQLRLLKTRPKLSGGTTEEDRWRDMYMIIFPDTKTVPSPCE